MKVRFVTQMTQFCFTNFHLFSALRHHTLSQLRQLQDVEGFGKILMGLRNVRRNFCATITF